MDIYKILSVETDKQNTQAFKLQVIGTSTIIDANLEEVVGEKISKKICKQQSYIMSLIKIAYKEKNFKLIQEISDKYFKNSTDSITKMGILISALYISFMIISNFAGAKLVELFGYTITAGIIFFPFTYIFDDIITEIYGYKFSRKTIWLGFTINTLVILGCTLATAVEPSKYWNNQNAFETVFYNSPKILIASIVSYFFGEFLNAVILSKMKIMTQGKHFWLRAISSTSIAALVDSVLFITIAFYSILPKEIYIQTIIVQFCFKVGYELLLLPLTAKIVKIIKAKEQIDTFDFNVSYNPFRF